MLGVFLVFLTRLVAKTVMVKFLNSILNVHLSHLKDSDPVLRRKASFMELATKFVTCFAMGFNIVFSIPALFRYLGIERPTFYTEI